MADCILHKGHRPTPLVIVTHHVVPLGMGGPDEAGNRRDVCDTGHRNVHTILAGLVFDKPVKGGTRTERALARDGYNRWVALGKPGNPHAAYASHLH